MIFSQGNHYMCFQPELSGAVFIENLCFRINASCFAATSFDPEKASKGVGSFRSGFMLYS
jgi:hypothetical protein